MCTKDGRETGIQKATQNNSFQNISKPSKTHHLGEAALFACQDRSVLLAFLQEQLSAWDSVGLQASAAKHVWKSWFEQKIMTTQNIWIYMDTWNLMDIFGINISTIHLLFHLWCCFAGSSRAFFGPGACPMAKSLSLVGAFGGLRAWKTPCLALKKDVLPKLNKKETVGGIVDDLLWHTIWNMLNMFEPFLGFYFHRTHAILLLGQVCFEKQQHRSICHAVQIKPTKPPGVLSYAAASVEGFVAWTNHTVNRLLRPAHRTPIRTENGNPHQLRCTGKMSSKCERQVFQHCSKIIVKLCHFVKHRIFVCPTARRSMLRCWESYLLL